ncbi:MAG: hypothetical protein K0U63_09045 [Cyanobacteria bacterium]|nr:hypothetical protein [Cyanobacteriota bacterium]
MRTTLDIEDDVRTGQMVSLLLRAALTGTGDSAQPPAAEVAGIASFRPFPARGQVVTNDTIDRLRDEAGL